MFAYKKTSGIAAIILLVIFGIICVNTPWRLFNLNTLQVEVANGLNINQVEVIWTDRMGDSPVFKNGKQIKKFEEVPPFWDVVYADTLLTRIRSGEYRDYREDYDYKFRIYQNNDTLFCDYSRNKEHTIRKLVVGTPLSKRLRQHQLNH